MAYRRYIRELTRNMGVSRCYLPSGRGDIPTFSPAKDACSRFSDPGGMQGWVDLGGLVTYWYGIPARRRSPIPVLTGLNVEICALDNSLICL